MAPGFAQGVQPVGETEGDPFEDRSRQTRRIGIMVEAQPSGTDMGIIERRPLSGKIGKEDFGAGSRRSVGRSPQQSVIPAHT